jgi:pyruvate kinase
LESQYTKTKTLCTIGPASDSKETITNLVRAGMDGIRLNFSHGDYEYYTKVYDNIHSSCTETAEPIAVLADLQGPKIRLGELSSPEIEVKTGDKIEVTAENTKGTADKISVSYKKLPTDASVGDKILIDDGLIRLEVIGKRDNVLECLILNGGILKPKKGVNLPGMKLTLPSVTKKDFADLDFAFQHRVDYVALSFVRTPEDIIELKKFIEKKNLNKFVIAKIEKQEAVDNFDNILKEADGIMIARGDLGVELPPQKVPIIQKEIIQKCNAAGKLVITATQMLESMVEHPVPTRAEASDVANAVWDGTDVVMLSEETAIGKYPLDAVKMMDSILRETEAHMNGTKSLSHETQKAGEENLFDSAGKAVTSMAAQLRAGAIATITKQGRLARVISKFKPQSPIIAFSDNFEVMNMLRLNWGVLPVFVENIAISESEIIQKGINKMKDLNFVKAGETVIFASGSPADEKGPVVWIRVVIA